MKQSFFFLWIEIATVELRVTAHAGNTEGLGHGGERQGRGKLGGWPGRSRGGSWVVGWGSAG